MDIQYKLKLLKHKLSAYDNLAVAFSGGVDSTFLLLVAKEVLGDSALAITMTGPNFSPTEIDEAKKFCDKHHIPHLILSMEESTFNSFSHNPIDRCYLCKQSIFSHMKKALPLMTIADGTNVDDSEDYRPGRLALKELGVISPLEASGFTKKEIRQGLKAMNIRGWDKPAYACLASRIPYGEEITKEKLKAIHEIETRLHELGFLQVRLRHHGNIARIEVLPEDRERFCSPSLMDEINDLVKQYGFSYVTLDLQGYVMGKLNK